MFGTTGWRRTMMHHSSPLLSPFGRGGVKKCPARRVKRNSPICCKIVFTNELWTLMMCRVLHLTVWTLMMCNSFTFDSLDTDVYRVLHLAGSLFWRLFYNWKSNPYYYATTTHSLKSGERGACSIHRERTKNTTLRCRRRVVRRVRRCSQRGCKTIIIIIIVQKASVLWLGCLRVERER